MYFGSSIGYLYARKVVLGIKVRWPKASTSSVVCLVPQIHQMAGK